MIRYVTSEDEKQILSLMEMVKQDFAGYKEKEFLEALYQAIDRKEAILEEEGNEIAGLLLFSKEETELSFLAVNPACRRRGVAKSLIHKMTESFKPGDTVEVVTFRNGDPKGTAAIACYHSCGFRDEEEIVVFDYPCQRMLLKI